MTPSEAFAETMVANGVTDMFGIVGSAFKDAMGIFTPAGIELTAVVHEQGATHMAGGYARVSGRHGLVIGRNGSRIGNCVTGIADAYWAHSPVVIVTPQAGANGSWVPKVLLSTSSKISAQCGKRPSIRFAPVLGS